MMLSLRVTTTSLQQQRVNNNSYAKVSFFMLLLISGCEIVRIQQNQMHLHAFRTLEEFGKLAAQQHNGATKEDTSTPTSSIERLINDFALPFHGSNNTVDGSTFCTLFDNNLGLIQGLVSERGWEIPYLQQTRDKNLCLSLAQQLKFYIRKDTMMEWVMSTTAMRSGYKTNTTTMGKHLLYESEKDGQWFAYVLNKKYAFRHIFKNGGTTVEKQTGRRQTPRSKLSNQTRLLATVRDPIDHFLSGWAEFGKRLPRMDSNGSHDDRVRNYLNLVKKCIATYKWQHSKPYECKISVHSHPQATFLLDLEHPSKMLPNIEFIGHLQELPGLLELAGFHYDSTIEIGRSASADHVKVTKYPRRKDLLSDGLVRDLCKFLALDYYLFAFEIPQVCEDLLVA